MTEATLNRAKQLQTDYPDKEWSECLDLAYQQQIDNFDYENDDDL